jgi:hypothetical protein
MLASLEDLCWVLLVRDAQRQQLLRTAMVMAMAIGTAMAMGMAMTTAAVMVRVEKRMAMATAQVEVMATTMEVAKKMETESFHSVLALAVAQQQPGWWQALLVLVTLLVQMKEALLGRGCQLLAACLMGCTC